MPIKALDDIKKKQELIQQTISDKLKNNVPLTDAEIDNYILTDEDKELYQIVADVAAGKNVSGFSFKDFLGTPQAKTLIPRVIIGTMRKTVEPMYLASKFYKKVRMNTGTAVMFPAIGVMRAYDVAEGQEIPQDTIDWSTNKTSLITIGKYGVRVQVTDELMNDSDWDIVGMLLQEAGRAMGRHLEEKAFKEWLKHGWIVFDNNLRASDPVKWAAAGTNGVDFTNNLNNTMNIDDFLDLLIACYNNEYTPTDLVMHPLAWTSFVKNGLTGVYTSINDLNAVPQSPNAAFKIGPDSIQGRLPFSFTVNLSPFAPINKINKTFDMFVVDRNNVGVQIVKDDMKTENFRDPARDITNAKVIARSGFGTFNEGRAICSARNISMAKGYPLPIRNYQVNQ